MLKEYWYPGCASIRLGDTPLPTNILGTRLALFRMPDGSPRALLDRCCHRGYPLSRSRLSNGQITCAYHGYQYDDAGRCVKIPCQPADNRIPDACRVTAFPCEEKDGYVWVWMGGSEKKPCPTIPEFASGKWRQGFREAKCNFMRALEITYDSAHVYTTHPTHWATMFANKNGMMQCPFEVRRTKEGCVGFVPPTQSETDPIPPGATRMEFALPGRIRFELPWPNGKLHMYFHIVPTGDATCRIESLVQFPAPNAPHVFWTERMDVIEEDLERLEAIQPAYEEEGEGFEQSSEADTLTLFMRKIIRQAEKGEFAGADGPSGRRVFSMMVGRPDGVPDQR